MAGSSPAGSLSIKLSDARCSCSNYLHRNGAVYGWGSFRMLRRDHMDRAYQPAEFLPMFE